MKYIYNKEQCQINQSKKKMKLIIIVENITRKIKRK